MSEMYLGLRSAQKIFVSGDKAFMLFKGTKLARIEMSGYGEHWILLLLDAPVNQLKKLYPSYAIRRRGEGKGLQEPNCYFDKADELSQALDKVDKVEENE